MCSMCSMCVCVCLRMCLWSSLKFCSFWKTFTAWFLLSSWNCSSASAKSQRFVNEIIEVSTGSGTGSCWCVSQVVVPKVSSMKNNWHTHILTHKPTHADIDLHSLTQRVSFALKKWNQFLFTCRGYIDLELQLVKHLRRLHWTSSIYNIHIKLH